MTILTTNKTTLTNKAKAMNIVYKHIRETALQCQDLLANKPVNDIYNGVNGYEIGAINKKTKDKLNDILKLSKNALHSVVIYDDYNSVYIKYCQKYTTESGCTLYFYETVYLVSKCENLNSERAQYNKPIPLFIAQYNRKFSYKTLLIMSNEYNEINDKISELKSKQSSISYFLID